MRLTTKDVAVSSSITQPGEWEGSIDGGHQGLRGCSRWWHVFRATRSVEADDGVKVNETSMLELGDLEVAEEDGTRNVLADNLKLRGHIAARCRDESVPECR